MLRKFRLSHARHQRAVVAGALGQSAVFAHQAPMAAIQPSRDAGAGRGTCRGAADAEKDWENEWWKTQNLSKTLELST